MKHLDDAQRDALARGGQDAGAEAAAHHAACAECQASVRDAQARRRLLGGLTAYTLSDMAFRRVEARLMEQVEEGLPAGSPWLKWLLPLGVVAAALVAVVVLQARAPAAPEVVALPRPPAPVAAAPFSPLTALRAAPDSQVRAGAGAWRALAAGDVLAAGDAVSSLGLAFAPAGDVAWAFEGQGSLALGGAATVSVGAGQVTAQVKQAVLVSAGTRQFSSAQALFLVSRSAAEVVLSVADGAVEVTDSATFERRRVTAPTTLRWADGAPLSSAREEPLLPVRAPFTAKPPWARLDASGLPAGTLVSLDGAALGQAPLVSLVTAGRHRLGLTPPGQPSSESWADLVGEVPFVAALPEVLEAPPPSEEALARVQAELLRHRPKLAACYEKWLKANPTASGTADLSLVVSASGRVKSARVEGAVLPKASADCLVRTAKGLTLPPLGTEAELQVPLVFTSGR
ncbi:MAG: AgmX/PglI C-terminal domain-containing protein [Myxococcales bacterium]|nr:AgmX/PglI C-terminal domain-containing protein [Myxococcales bacterium]